MGFASATGDVAEELRNILERITDAFVAHDRQWRFTYLNRRAERYFGRTREDLLGKNVWEEFPAAVGGTYYREIRRAVAEQTSIEFAIPALFDDRWYGVIAYPSAEGVSVYLRDITAQRAAEQALRESEENRRFIAEAGKQIVGKLVPDDKLEGLARLLVPRLADACIVDLLEGDAVRRVAVACGGAAPAASCEELRRFPPTGPRFAGVDKVLRTGEPELVPEVTHAWLRAAAVDEDHLRVARDLRIRSIMMVPVVVEGRPGGVLSFLSLSPERRYGPADFAFAQAIADWAALAVAHSRLYGKALRAAADRDEILGIVSHDLRSPLHNITIAAQLAALCTDDARAHVHLSRVRRAAGWATKLIEELLDAARLDAGKLALDRRPQHAGAVAAEVIELQRSASEEKRVELASTISPDLPRILVDRDRMLQVLGNLVDNAIKHTPPGGRVTLSAERAGACLELAVADMGPGIPPDLAARVFDRFWQARSHDGMGVGLGLAIAKGIVEAHGGAIWVESRVGLGTTFRLTCPIAEGP
ncbi:MAG: ATP-binding protein [Minicystis sp.]